MTTAINEIIAKHRQKAAQTNGAEAPPPQEAAPSKVLSVRPPAQISGEIPELNTVAQEVAIESYEQQIAELNKTFFVAPWGGVVRIFNEAFDYEMGRPSLIMHKPEGFRLLLKNRSMTTTDTDNNTKRVPLAEAWLVCPVRREYPDGIAMLPNQETPTGVYNLYRGLGIKPCAGDHAPALRHILKVICSSDITLTKYVVGWCARAVQRPELPAEVALVLKGGRGTGKGTFAGWMLGIFGAHGMHISQSRHLTGNFNGHLRDCLLLFADESFFAGDKAAESVLKALITEDTMAIERKSVDVISAKNRLKIIMASNAEWVAPAGPDERRFCALNISDCHKQDHQYFNDLKHHMENGGLAAFLYFLLKHDISKFNIRAVPSTRALEEQKLLSMPPLASWLYARLTEGRLLAEDSDWKPRQTRDRICADFSDFVKTHGLRHVHVDSASVGRQLRVLIPTIKEARESVGARSLMPAIIDARESVGARRRQWVFPELADARDVFAKHMGLEHTEWLDDEVAE